MLMMVERLLMGMADMVGLDAPAMVVPTLPDIAKQLSPALTVSWTDDAGWPLKTLSPFPGSALLALNASGLSASQSAVAMGALLPALGSARRSARQVASASNMRQIAMASFMYAEDFDGELPPDLGILAEKGYTPGVVVFIHPVQ